MKQRMVARSNYPLTRCRHSNAYDPAHGSGLGVGGYLASHRPNFVAASNPTRSIQAQRKSYRGLLFLGGEEKERRIGS